MNSIGKEMAFAILREWDSERERQTKNSRKICVDVSKQPVDTVFLNYQWQSQTDDDNIRH